MWPMSGRDKRIVRQLISACCWSSWKKTASAAELEALKYKFIFNI